MKALVHSKRVYSCSIPNHGCSSLAKLKIDSAKCLKFVFAGLSSSLCVGPSVGGTEYEDVVAASEWVWEDGNWFQDDL